MGLFARLLAPALAGAVLLFATSAAGQISGGVVAKPPFVTGDCVRAAGPGAISTTGSTCGGGGGSGTVNAGTLGQAGYYATAGTAISGTSALILSATEVTMSPSGIVTIAPSSVSTMNNVVIGGVTPLAGTFTVLQANTSLKVGGSAAFTGAGGNSATLATASGTLTSGDCVSIDANGNFIAAGGPCTTGGGGGTVNNGTANQLTYYGSTGTAVSGNANFTVSGGALTAGIAGSVQGSYKLTGATSGTATIRVDAAAGTPTFWLPSSNGTAGQPLLSGAGSAAMTWGSLSGNTTTFATTSGALTNGNCVSIDASGNLVDSGGGCSGSAVINAGTTGQTAFYAADGTALSGTSALILTTTSANLSPSGAVTINPTSAGTINNMAIGGTTAAAGNFTSIGAASTGSGLFTTLGASSSLTLNGSTALTSASGNGAILVTSTGAQTNGRCVTIDASGNHVAAAAGCGTGTVTSVDVSGGTTGLTFSGGPVTSSGTITASGTLAVANGGTGQTTYTDGQLLIGNTTGNTLAKSTLTAGSGISITNGSGTITIAASGSASAPSVKTANFNASAGGTYCPATTTAAGTVTATLPASPTNGDTIAFWDCQQSFATYNLVLARNGNTIMNSATDMTVSTNNANFKVTYVSDGGITTWIMN